MCENKRSSNTRSIRGYIFHCLACNRQLSDTESTRTYPKSDELIGLCTTCLSKSKEFKYSYEFEQSYVVDGVSSANHVDSHSSYYYEYFD